MKQDLFHQRFYKISQVHENLLCGPNEELFSTNGV